MILLELDPDVVKPGWTPLIITLLLGAVMVFLFFSMRRQFRKISIPREGEDEDVAGEPSADGEDPDGPDRATPPTAEPASSREDPPVR